LFCLIFFFALVAAADFVVPIATTAAEGAHPAYLLKIAGGWGLAASLFGWYLALQHACTSTGVPVSFPNLDFSYLFAKATTGAKKRTYT